MKKETKAINTPYQREDAYGALSMPVYNNVSYEFGDAKTMSDAFCNRIDAPDYGRCENPTTRHFEDCVKNATGAKNVIAFNTGMAAISNTMLAISRTGKNVITSKHLFGNTYSLLTQSLKRFGVETRLADLTNPAEVEALVDENTCCIFFEIITNPQMEVADARALSKIAKAHRVPLVADTTLIPFTEFDGKELGIDIQVVSSTKYISGGGTSLGGLIIDHGTIMGFGQFVKLELLFNFGAYMNPQTAYMQTIGLETLAARYKMQSQNAMTFAKALREMEGVKYVNYNGLDDNPYHELCTSLYGPTYGCMVTMELESKEACFDFINNLKLIHRATNLFDNRTLAIHPASTIFGLFSPKQKVEMDVKENLIRFSVGLENVDDLLADVKQALGK